MTLNGLIPDTEYDIYCFHLSHGIISNYNVRTDKLHLQAFLLLHLAQPLTKHWVV